MFLSGIVVSALYVVVLHVMKAFFETFLIQHNSTFLGTKMAEKG
jgi:hypothetical protein